MNIHEDLSYMETLYMALADKTRLRLLNLMRDQEICVFFFTEVLGDSQPKISRHLAYLRNAGVVAARRDGKWINYSVRWPEDEGGRNVLRAALDWLSQKEEMNNDRDRYQTLYGGPKGIAKMVSTPIPFISADANMTDEPVYDDTVAAHNEIEEFLL